VTYEASTIALRAGDQQNKADQPVTGKSYVIERRNGELAITYQDGSSPPPEELAIVAENMGSFGLPNPIARFFHGRTVRVGQLLELPAELARDLVGFTQTTQSLSKFQLRLVEVRPPTNQAASATAVFVIELRADDPEQSGVSMTLDGRMEMETQTCRARAVELSGPVAVSEKHGPAEAQYEVHSQGEIRVAVQANYLRQ
jgi:hypothetical protein